MLLNPTELAKFAESLSSLQFNDAFLFGGYCQELKRIIGVPDFVVSDKTSCILGEIKISAKYDITQFVKYFAPLKELKEESSS